MQRAQHCQWVKFIVSEILFDFIENALIYVAIFQCFSERLQREKEIVEERAERRMEILKNLVNRTVEEMDAVSTDENAAKVNADGCNNIKE